MTSLSTSELIKKIAEHEERLRKIEEILRLRAPDITAEPVPPLPSPAEEAVKKTKPKRIILDLGKMDEMSKTELTQFAHRAGYVFASRLLNHDDLQGLLLGEVDAALVVRDPLEGPRERTRYHVDGNKTLMVSEMPCDLNCRACPLDTLLTCYHVNHERVDSHYAKREEEGEVS